MNANCHEVKTILKKLGINYALYDSGVKVSRDDICQAFPDGTESTSYLRLIQTLNSEFTPHRFHYNGKTDDFLFLELVC